MSKHLLIVESPAKAKTLHKYLGKDYEVMASYGHVRDLVPKNGAVDTADDFATSTKSPKRRKPPKTSTSQRTPIAKAKPSPGTCAKSCANAARSITKTSTALPSTKSPKTPSSKPSPTRASSKWTW